MDNLNTHSTGSLYEAFKPEEARALARRLEIHYTPRHGSWLNMAETELSVPTRQCLSMRIPTKAQMKAHVNALGSTPQSRQGSHRLALHDR